MTWDLLEKSIYWIASAIVYTVTAVLWVVGINSNLREKLYTHIKAQRQEIDQEIKEIRDRADRDQREKQEQINKLELMLKADVKDLHSKIDRNGDLDKAYHREKMIILENLQGSIRSIQEDIKTIKDIDKRLITLEAKQETRQ